MLRERFSKKQNRQKVLVGLIVTTFPYFIYYYAVEGLSIAALLVFFAYGLALGECLHMIEEWKKKQGNSR